MITIRFDGNLAKLEKRFKKSPLILAALITEALGKSISMVQLESQRRTPVDTGLLKSSIGGAGGIKFVRGYTAEVGTNVEYALAVHEGHANHAVGERKFMEKGAKASMPFIEKQMGDALKKLSVILTRGLK